MISIFEFGYRYLIPSIKRRLVEKLLEMGLTRNEIARRLNLSASTVSRYLSMERGHLINIVAYSDLDEAVGKLAQSLKNNPIDLYNVQIEIHRVAFYALSKGYMCKYHAKIDPTINPNKCPICSMLFQTETTKNAAENVKAYAKKPPQIMGGSLMNTRVAKECSNANLTNEG